MPFQKGWRWCKNCDALFHELQPNVCPRGGRHDSTGSGYYLALLSPSAGAQDGWRWCRKCGGLVFSQVSGGRCAAGGTHDWNGSSAYSVSTGTPLGNVQNGWRWCKNCQSLFFGQRQGGSCPAGGAHSADGSGDYSVSLRLVGSGIVVAHEGLGNSGELWVSYRQNGQWLRDFRIDAGTSGTPSVIMHDNLLYIFYQGMGDCRDLYYTTFDGANYSQSTKIPDVRIKGAPTANVCKGELSVYLQGTSSDYQLWRIVKKGTSWESYTPGPCMIWNDPGAVTVPFGSEEVSWSVYESAVHTGSFAGVQSQSARGTGSLYLTPWGYGQVGVPTAGGSTGTPGAVYYNGQVYIFHEGANGSGQLFYHLVNPGSAPNSKPTFVSHVQVPCGMSAVPAPVVEGNQLYVFHEGYGDNGELFYVTYDGTRWLPDQRVPDVGVSTGCGAATFRFDP